MMSSSRRRRGEEGRKRGTRPVVAALLAVAAALAVARAPLAARAQYVDPDPNVLPKGDGPLYASAAQIYSAMDRWAAASPRYFSVYKAIDPVTGTSFPVGRFTDTQPPPGSNSRKKRILVTCAVHARELIVPEVCLHVFRLLVGTPADKRPVVAWPETLSALRRANITSSRVIGGGGLNGGARDPLASFSSAFGQAYDLHIAPLINLSGRMLIERTGKYSQRKTANADDGSAVQTDINRNYPYGWSDANKDLNSETYPGPYPASSWETRAIVALMSAVEPHALLDVHSGVAAYLTPLGRTCSQLEVTASSLPPLQASLDAVVRIVGNITAGPSAALLYTSMGTGGDHAYGGAGIESSVTLEVFGGSSGVLGKGVLCPRLQTWNDKCRLPASSDDAAVGCTAECGSDANLRCKNILGKGMVAMAMAAGAGAATNNSSLSSFSSSPAVLSARAAVSRRSGGLSPAVARWQQQLAEASAEDPGILVPDGELFWTEFEREREREAEAKARGSGAGGVGSAIPSEPVPAHLRHLSGKELERALSERRALRVSLTAELARVVGGAPLADGASSLPSSSSSQAAPVPAAADPAEPAWQALDPCMRHIANATDRSYFYMFNPGVPAQYRKVVADYSAAILAFASSAAKGPAYGRR